jgi:hypothetical protein
VVRNYRRYGLWQNGPVFAIATRGVQPRVGGGLADSAVKSAYVKEIKGS